MIYFRVPFICKFKPGIPGISTPEGGYDENEDEEEEEPQGEDFHLGDEMYSLKVQLVSEHDETRATLLETRTDNAMVRLLSLRTLPLTLELMQVSVGDKIYVASHINAVPYLALAMEQCWISNTSQVTAHATPRDHLMINSGCPTNSGVNMHWDKGSSNSAFSFKVLPLMREPDK